MWRGRVCPSAATVAAPVASALCLRPPFAVPLRPAECFAEARRLFRPREGLRLFLHVGRRRNSHAASRCRPPRRLWVRCVAAVPDGGASLTWWRDAGAAALVMGGAYALVLCFGVLSRRELIDQKLSRKVVHVLSGIFFISSWPIFSSSIEARFFAALVPLVSCVRLTVYGLSLVKDEGLIKSLTRNGKPEELLRGPLYFVVVLMICVLVFWRDSPVGVVALAMMSGGDGIADIMGRKFGTAKLPYNSEKSWVGSICMFTVGFFISMGMMFYFSSLGYFGFDWPESAKKVALVSLTATLVESLPITDVLDDNLSVPLSSILMASLLFGYGTP